MQLLACDLDAPAMNGKRASDRFSNIGFDDFRRLARDPSLSAYEKIGFPDEYREGKEQRIFADILMKLTTLANRASVVLDIGPGCSEIPRMLIAHCEDHEQELHFVDSEEMLDQLPHHPHVNKTAARYPDCPELLQYLHCRADAIIVYSVLQYVFAEANLWDFLDRTLNLLAPGGMLLLGDIPNQSMRKRFFSSGTGREFHTRYVGRDEEPEIFHNRIEHGQIDDAVVFGILHRARISGFHGYVLPQPADLPMSNRREDILIVRP